MRGAWLAVVGLVGCPGPDDSDTADTEDTHRTLDPPEGDAATVELAGACPLAERVGGFTIADLPDYAIVEGAVSDGVVPLQVLETVDVVDDCVVLRKNNPFCADPCDADETCDFDGQCVPFPVGQDQGEVTVAGLARDVFMRPVQPGFLYFDTSLPRPPFAAGALVQLRAPDAGFDLHGVGVEPLVVLADPWVVTDGQPLEVTWTPPATPGRAVVHLRLAVDQHGTSPATVECLFDDDGSGVVPAEVTSAVVAAGVSGFPNGALSRRTVDRADAEHGCVDLVLHSRRTPDVRVAGFTPCDEPADCVDGLVCDLDLETCVEAR
jgi:hypothetical protein